MAAFKLSGRWQSEPTGCLATVLSVVICVFVGYKSVHLVRNGLQKAACRLPSGLGEQRAELVPLSCLPCCVVWCTGARDHAREDKAFETPSLSLSGRTGRAPKRMQQLALLKGH